MTGTGLRRVEGMAGHDRAGNGRVVLAGLPLAFAVAIKPHLVLILPIVVWQAPRIVLGAIAGGTALLLVSIGAAGFDSHLRYVTDVLPTLGNGYAFFPNQSWNGVLNRMVHDNMSRFVIAPPSDLVRIGTLALGLLTLGLAVYAARRPSTRPASSPAVRDPSGRRPAPLTQDRRPRPAT